MYLTLVSCDIIHLNIFTTSWMEIFEMAMIRLIIDSQYNLLHVITWCHFGVINLVIAIISSDARSFHL